MQPVDKTEARFLEERFSISSLALQEVVADTMEEGQDGAEVVALPLQTIQGLP
jgi:hypothetical protein